MSTQSCGRSFARDAVTAVFARAYVFGEEETCVRGQEKRPLLVLCVIRSSSYGLSNVCVSSVCLHVVRGAGRIGPNRADASALSEERERERRVLLRRPFFFNKLSKVFFLLGRKLGPILPPPEIQICLPNQEI